MNADKLKNLSVRIVSALVVVVLLFLSYYAMGAMGLLLFCLIFYTFVLYEGSRLLAIDQLPSLALKVIYYCSTGLIFFLILFLSTKISFYFYTMVSVFFMLCSMIISIKSSMSLDDVFKFQLKLYFTWFYLGMLPATCLELLLKNNGAQWFIVFLLLVFSGDIMAYLFGMFFGKNLLLPEISPKKTWEGAIGGLVATVVTAIVSRGVLSIQVSLFDTILFATFLSFLAQAGDFFESLLKRVSNVKDSGQLMPGHGGLLDRIDGVLFAAPLMSLAVSYIDKLS
jgi:phosphatidate cytidylyltransferase